MHFEIELFRPPTENEKSSYLVFGGNYFDSWLQLAKKYNTIEEARKDFKRIKHLSDHAIHTPGKYVLRIIEITDIDYSIRDYKEFTIN